MQSLEGWFFDVYIQQNEAILWFKTDDNELIRLRDRYKNFVYVLPRDENSKKDLIFRLEETGFVDNIIEEEKKTELGKKEKKKLLRLEINLEKQPKCFLKSLEKSPFVEKVFCSDLRHVQKYLFTQLKIEPTSRVKTEYNADSILHVEKIDDDKIVPPPFKMSRLFVEQKLGCSSKQISSMRIITNNDEVVFDGTEASIIDMFSSYLSEKSIDLVFTPKCDSFTFPFITERALANGIIPSFGRCSDKEQVRKQGSFGGRIFLGDIFYGYNADEWGIAGLVERSRFSFLPMGLATRWKSNKSIDSRNCFELMERGYVIPRENYFESVRSLSELMQLDRGGLIFTPELGLHENVGVLDFDSQFPSIIVKEGLSYEIESEEQFRLIPEVIRPFIARRLFLKSIKKTLPKESPLRKYCEQRIEALKLINVTQYGITGCCWNRFGNAKTFEAINKASRNAMIRAKEIADSLGFRIIYGDVDSIFVSKSGAIKRDYENLASAIASETGLSISLDKHFKFIVFLRHKNDCEFTALKRYFGLTYDGEIDSRGIEVRRDDIPDFIKEFQLNLISTVLDFENANEVYTEGIRKGLELTNQTLDMIRNGSVLAERLFIKKRIWRDPSDYNVNVAHSVAAQKLISVGRKVDTGDNVGFLYIDHRNPNPLLRVEILPKWYDKEYYSKMIINTAKTIFESLKEK